MTSGSDARRSAPTPSGCSSTRVAEAQRHRRPAPRGSSHDRRDPVHPDSPGHRAVDRRRARGRAGAARPAGRRSVGRRPRRPRGHGLARRPPGGLRAADRHPDPLLRRLAANRGDRGVDAAGGPARRGAGHAGMAAALAGRCRRVRAGSRGGAGGEGSDPRRCGCGCGCRCGCQCRKAGLRPPARGGRPGLRLGRGPVRRGFRPHGAGRMAGRRGPVLPAGRRHPQGAQRSCRRWRLRGAGWASTS